MSKFFSFCNTNKQKHYPTPVLSRKKTVSFKGNYFGFSLVLLFFVFASFAFYVFDITSSSVQGFEISAKEQKLFELHLENEKLTEKSQMLSDLVSVKERAEQMGLEPIKQVSYLDTSVSSFALAK
jgi:hypothetical protein